MKRIFTSLVFLSASFTAFAQFTTPTIDATFDNATIYPNTYTSGTPKWSVTWNNTDFFVYLSDANQTEPVSIYLDVDPLPVVNGGTDANGTLVGLNYDGYTTRPNLPFRADICIYAHSGYREIFRRNGSNGWTSLGSTPHGLNGSLDDYTSNSAGHYSTSDNGNGNGPDDKREFRVSWSRLLGSINGGNRPTAFNWMGYISYSNGMYGQVPIENYGGNSVTTNANGIVRYFTVSSTADGASTAPFARNSFTQPLTASNSSFGGISVYDFTMNSSGQTITRSSGNWMIGGNLTVNSGTLAFGSTTGSCSVTGNVSVGGTLTLSSAIGGDINVGGNFTNNGTFNSNTRAVQFNGIGTQTISGTSATAIDYLVLNTTVPLQLNRALTVNSNLTFTNGKIELGANTLTLGAATITGNSATKYVVTNGTGGLNLLTTSSISRLFPIGASSSSYDPVTITPTTGVNFEVYVKNALSNSVSTSNKVVPREWNITATGQGATTLAFTPLSTLLDMNNTPSSSVGVAGHWNGSSWDTNIATAYAAGTWTITGYTGTFSPFVVAAPGVVLAAELTSFKGSTAKGQNILDWSTASEKNAAHFDIQRSSDNTAWTSIGQVKAVNNAYGSDYQFIDAQPLSGTNYYRLQMVDANGATELSKIVAVNASTGNKSLKIYPNPAKDVLTILTDANTEGVSIFDINGRLVLSVVDKSQNVNIQKLASGVYFVRMMDKMGFVGSPVRFVKQ